MKTIEHLKCCFTFWRPSVSRRMTLYFAEQFVHCPATSATTDLDREAALVSQVVELTNNYIAHNHGHEGMFATIFFGVLEAQTGQLEFVNAGHEPLYVVGRNGIRTRLAPTGPAVGLMPATAYRHVAINLARGDVLMGYTDGLTEARSPDGELFTRNRLLALLTNPPYSAGALLDKVRNSLSNFIGSAPRDDDVTMIAVQRAAS